MNLTIIFLQGGGFSAIANFLPLVMIMLVFYMFFIRPQAKKQKEQNEFVANLEKGTEVVTNSGIVGRINKIEDQFVHLQIDQKTFLKVVKGSISKEMSDGLGSSEKV